jgi:precorrin-6B methylase 2
MYIWGAFLFSLLMVGFIVGFMHLLLSMRNKVPYVAAPPRVLAQIVAALKLPEQGVLWDLGCGDGRVLRAAHKASPGLGIAGVDNNPMPLQLARWSLGRAARLVHGDILAIDLHKAARVFVYLGPELMEALEPRFEQLPKGARVVSMQFALPHRKPTSEIVLEHGRPYAAKLYVYDY